MKPTGPFLKWVGSKRQLLVTRNGVPGVLAVRLPPTFADYHEPMVGGGALFFHLRATGRLTGRVHLGDANERLIRCWRGVRDQVEQVIARLYRLADQHEQDPDAYTEIRDASPDSGADAEVAAWFLYINRAGFNGLYRVNREGRCNTPSGGVECVRVDPAQLRACSAALQGVDLRIEDFAAAARARRGDLVYFDPPYVPLTDAPSFTSYTAAGFGPGEQARLRDTARALARRGVHVLASNSDSPAARELWGEGFAVERVEARRAINSDPTKRGAVGELVIVGGAA